MHLLYCDIDGVLSVKEARSDQLFEFADDLAFLLMPYPAIRLLLASSWVEWYTYERARLYLPEPLRRLTIGATRQESGTTRAGQILADVALRAPTSWLAIDDDAEDGWPQRLARHLFGTDPEKGLGCS